MVADGVGTIGVELDGTDSVIVDSEVSHTGCAGMATTGGNQRTLERNFTRDLQLPVVAWVILTDCL